MKRDQKRHSEMKTEAIKREYLEIFQSQLDEIEPLRKRISDEDAEDAQVNLVWFRSIRAPLEMLKAA